MKASVILSHPYDKSFNHAIFNQVINKLKELDIQIFSHDLYNEKFNPILTKEELGKEETADLLVKKYIQEMLDSKYLIFIHPNWWGQPPAIMKGYIDRVFRPPYAYDFPKNDSGGGLPIEKLKGKIGIVINTSNTSEERESSIFNDPLENEWINCVFGFCGIINTYRKTFRIVSESDLETRKKWLQEVDEIVLKKCT